ncbi:hypothetical protein L227DRAFT_157986 [Lentinus tigrinus ALCF2SS1-6]|uniref:MIT domain-containing protein n=2 Tax=Lentinus tigrinus TaxID=5365 RepID=A0A5C2S6K1_9APHY|nr:hypothetical protein L227DRAFT_157986 [Lentinus tigrinus ALCF2SS1-6]
MLPDDFMCSAQSFAIRVSRGGPLWSIVSTVFEMRMSSVGKLKFPVVKPDRVASGAHALHATSDVLADTLSERVSLRTNQIEALKKELLLPLAAGGSEHWRIDEGGLLPRYAPPGSSREKSSRPSMKRTLSKALKLAHEADQLESKGGDPHLTLMAYAKTITTLNQAIQLTSRLDSPRHTPTDSTEEEVRRIVNIRDTYNNRMQTLSSAHGIPMPEIPWAPDAFSGLTSGTSSPSSSHPTPLVSRK